MWKFRKIDFIKAVSAYKYIALTGSGGKTSLMEHLAGEFLKLGRTVAITTTTKIFVKEPYLLLDEGPDVQAGSPFIRVGRNNEKGKLTAVSFEDIEMLGSIYDVVLIEADGAKSMPLKFPASYEPVIPPFCEKVIVICGLDGLYGRVNEKVFRWKLFCEATGIINDALITRDVFLRLFDKDALLKGIDIEKCMIVLNKYDALNIRKEAIETGKEIIARTGIRRLTISSTLFNVFYGIEVLNP
ncbi:MAG: selenium cofactor biosynthesis protein YqeC [Proteobacteria bacterium]|nr:selenium cofactor biosynthesis protein YqeC [Pseudomonadota bacterium]